VKRAARRRLAAVARLAGGFAAGLVFWIAFREPYERFLAAAAETVVRAAEHPAVTRLTASNGEILVERSDFPPSAPRPGLPAADVHFDFVLLAALSALDRRPLAARRVTAFLAGAAVLAGIHVMALLVEIRSLYATGLGEWSAARYGPLARTAWAGAFHFWQIAGRFAAPFAIWWFLRDEESEAPDRAGRSGRYGLRRRSRLKNR